MLLGQQRKLPQPKREIDLVLFAPTLKNGARILLYKGPDVATEIAEASVEARKRQITMRILERYELPDAHGTRTIVELARQKA